MDRFSTFLISIFWMLPTVFPLPTDYRTDDGVANFLSVPAGSPFNLVEPEQCQKIESRSYELYYKGDMIASCDLRNCQSRLQFTNRVAFFSENCTFVVKDTTLADAGVYELITLINENDKLKNHKTTFNITVTDNVSIPPATDVSLPPERVGNVTANVLGFVYVCLSMAPLGNVICCLVHLLLFWQGDRFQTGVKKSLALSVIVSLICQVISIFFLPARNDNPVYLIIAIVCLVIAAVYNVHMVWLAFKGKQCRCFSFWQNETERTGPECKGWKYLCVISLVAQVAFAVCMMIHLHVTCGLINCWKIGYFFTSLGIFLAIHAVLCLPAYFCSSASQTNENQREGRQMLEMNPLHDGDGAPR